MTDGPIALVGSGEFLPVMDDVDRHLLDGRPQRVVFLPTAAAPEGPERIGYWTQLGIDHYARLGVEAEPLLVLDRDDAQRPDLASRIDGAGLVYMSGGNPAYLVDTLRDTAVWRAIVAAHLAGAAIAGCSAGAIALSSYVRDRFTADTPLMPALGVISGVAVLPHFDRLKRFAPQLVDVVRSQLPAGEVLLGIDEDTAVVGGPRKWTTMGRQQAWVYVGGGEPAKFPDGAVFEI